WVWTARATSAKGDYVALFNVSDAPTDLQYTWQDLGIPSGRHMVRDLWLHTKLGRTDGIKLTLAPHASALYRVE
ncbi:MAG: glycoside hydrolase family 27 protein, partial [Terriglobia bacterium]|nr:glycoside hydrolase family 27 protein [Terriglobia bacterium]